MTIEELLLITVIFTYLGLKDYYKHVIKLAKLKGALDANSSTTSRLVDFRSSH